MLNFPPGIDLDYLFYGSETDDNPELEIEPNEIVDTEQTPNIQTSNIQTSNIQTSNINYNDFSNLSTAEVLLDLIETFAIGSDKELPPLTKKNYDSAFITLAVNFGDLLKDNKRLQNELEMIKNFK